MAKGFWVRPGEKDRAVFGRLTTYYKVRLFILAQSVPEAMEITTQYGIPARLVKAKSKAEGYASHSRSHNTKRSYRASWTVFCDWCNENRLEALPATIGTVAFFVSDMADTRKYSTLESYMAAISVAHKMAGYDTPCRARDEPLSSVLQGIKNQHGTAREKVAPLMAKEISAIGDYINTALYNAGDKDRLALLRDKAILLMGFTGAMRRSEIVAVEVQNIRYTDEGMVIWLARSKGDQEGKGQEIPVVYQQKHCPVRAVRAWIDEGGISSGYVFRRIDRHGNIGSGEKPMRGGSVADIVKRYASAAGVNEKAVAGHSLRRGLATQLGRNGEPMHILMRHTRHKTEKVAREYIEAGTQFSQDNPTHRLGL